MTIALQVQRDPDQAAVIDELPLAKRPRRLHIQ
jgi:hypothetical protein